jgi:hypothetical protein
VSVIRILIHAQRDERLLEQVAGVLEQAVESYPDVFDKVKDEPGRVDHYGYSASVLSAVVLTREPMPMSFYWRLSIRPGEHPVFDELAALVIQELSPNGAPS